VLQSRGYRWREMVEGTVRLASMAQQQVDLGLESRLSAEASADFIDLVADHRQENDHEQE